MNHGRPITQEMEGPGCAESGKDGFALRTVFFQEEDFTAESALSCKWACLRNPETGSTALENGLVLTAGENGLKARGLRLYRAQAAAF